jgi:hypothetical protein
MSKGKAFIVVGHKHWGKSKTLKALTLGRLFHWFDINSHRFWVKRMSNDDVPDEIYELLKNLDPKEKPLVILALCPTFKDPDECKKLTNALKQFKSNYRIFFFVLPAAYLNQKKQINNTEKNRLEEFGTVEELSSPKAECEQRAKEFKKFIIKNVNA